MNITSFKHTNIHSSNHLQKYSKDNSFVAHIKKNTNENF